MHLYQLSIFRLQMRHKVGDKCAALGLGGIIVIGQLRQDVFQFAGVAAVAQDVACLPLHPGFFFMRLGIFAKFAYAEP